MKRVFWTVLLLAAVAAAQRLPGNVVPDNYKLHFEPDLQAATFTGKTRITVRVVSPTDTVVLHANNLRIAEVTVEQGGATQSAEVSEVAGAESQIALKVPKPLAPGEAMIFLRYSGSLNNGMTGIYVSRTAKRNYLASQMEATDARRAFPSFDEPAYKATFDISVTIDHRDTAISNGRVIEEKPIEGGKKFVRFSTTAKMSTYLVALTIGDFQCLSDKVHGIPLRVCAVPERASMLRFAMDATKFILPWFNRYYGVKYPFEKLDQVAVPDFGPGAMENTGAILYRETALLADDSTPIETKKQIASTISHEIAHQWFGNLVTMQWWDDIWLNEGFATWITSKPLRAWKPEWNMEVEDARETLQSMRSDSLRSTRAIRAKAETAAEIGELFDGIAYGKTAAVLRMIEGYAGEEAFRKAIAEYVKKYSYGNARAEDFWTLLAQSTGKPLDRIMQSFVLQPGVPAITLGDTCNDAQLTASQSRFLFLPDATDQRWTLPVCTNLPKIETKRERIRPRAPKRRACAPVEPATKSIPVASCNLETNPNARASGYYRVHYSNARSERLGQALEAMWPEERLWLMDNEWAMALAGAAPVSQYLDRVQDAARAGDAASLDMAAEGVLRIHEYALPEAARPKFQQWVRANFTPVVRTAESRPPADSGRQFSATLRLLAIAGNDRFWIRRARELASSYLQDPASLPPEYAAEVLAVAAAFGDASLYESYVTALRKPQSPAAYRALLDGLASFRDPALVKRNIELALSPEIRAQDAATLIASPMAATAGAPQTWELLKTNWDGIKAKLGDRAGATVAGATAAMCGTEAERDVRAFFAAHPVPQADRTIRQALESIAVCTQFREKQGAGVQEYFLK